MAAIKIAYIFVNQVFKKFRPYEIKVFFEMLDTFFIKNLKQPLC